MDEWLRGSRLRFLMWRLGLALHMVGAAIRPDPARHRERPNDSARETDTVGQGARLQVQLEVALADQAEWREVVAALPQIVWITRPDGYHVYFNRQWMDFTGLTLAESLGDGWNPPFHAGRTAPCRTPVG